MIKAWEKEMEQSSIKIDKRTNSASKDSYPNRLDEIGKNGNLSIYEKELIEMRVALNNREDIPHGFKRILNIQRSYIF